MKMKLMLFIVVSFLLTIYINIHTTLVTTWSLILISGIALIIIKPERKVSVAFLLISTVIKYGTEYYVNGGFHSMELLISFIANSLVNTVIMATVSYFAIQNYKLNSDLKNLAVRDPLTGVYNRRYLSMCCERKEEMKGSFILIDIDHFKNINDTYGHDYGDFVLKRVAKLITDNSKHQSVVIRMGGEEFAIFIPNISSQECYTIAECLRDKIENTTFFFNKEAVSVTVSMGLVDFNNKKNGIDCVVHQADKALYHSKRNGRNQVTLATSM